MFLDAETLARIIEVRERQDEIRIAVRTTNGSVVRDSVPMKAFDRVACAAGCNPVFFRTFDFDPEDLLGSRITVSNEGIDLPSNNWLAWFQRLSTGWKSRTA